MSQDYLQRRPEDDAHPLANGVAEVLPVPEAAYQRLNVLGRSIGYPPAQTPVLVTFSADNDKPRHTLFRLGRIAGEYLGGKPRKDDDVEKTMERNSLGFFGDPGIQVTHRLRPVDPQEELVATTRQQAPEVFCANVKRHDECKCQWYEWKPRPGRVQAQDTLPAQASTPAEIEQLLPRVVQYDFAQHTVFDNVELVPETGASAYQPIFVATVSKQIIDGHSGMFSGPFMRFLTSYVGFIEAKQYLLAAARKQQ